MAKVTKERIESERMPIFRKRFKQLVEEEGGITKFSTLTEAIDPPGFSRQSIGYWYNGPRVPDAESLLRLSKICSCSVDWLLGRVDEDNRTDDQKISAMAEYTGLSSDTIKEFHAFPQRAKAVSQICDINGSLLDRIGMYLFPKAESIYENVAIAVWGKNEKGKNAPLLEMDNDDIARIQPILMSKRGATPFDEKSVDAIYLTAIQIALEEMKKAVK